MINKKIIFCATNKEMLKVWPHPKAAKQFIPDEYKKLERFSNNDMAAGTVKTCIPFLDAITMGYIIPFDQDYIVNPVDKEFNVIPANQEQHDFGYHDKAQIPEEWHHTTGKYAGKFHNKWLIKTPPGYSCLFIKPMNRMEERFDLISGVVDTDTYVNVINFPFILKKRDKQFLIKKGEPMVQVIPFKREAYKGWVGFYKETKHYLTTQLLGSYWFDKYKRLFWHKKDYR
jgi:hypothetical protein